MENSNKELEPLKIRIVIYPASPLIESDDDFRKAVLQIDYTGMYLHSIFWFITQLSEFASLIELTNEKGLPPNFDRDFRTNTQFLTDIADGLQCELSLYSGKADLAKEELLDLSSQTVGENEQVDIFKQAFDAIKKGSLRVVETRDKSENFQFKSKDENE